MEMIYFTLAAIALYFVSDWILNQIEITRGARLRNRSLVFFAIIFCLSMASFAAVRFVAGENQSAESGISPADGPTPATTLQEKKE